jgi:MFS family permease
VVSAVSSVREFVPTAVAVVVICFTMNILARGTSETYAVFLIPLEAEFGWSRSQLTGVYATYMVVHGVAAPIAGALFDRRGPRAVYGLGLASLGLGYVLAGRLDALWQFHLCVGVLGGLGVAALGMVAASALVSRWFRVRLGTAMGIAYAGLGTGVIVLVPLTQWLIEQVGWRAAYTWLGGVLLAFLPVVLALPWGRLLDGPHVSERPGVVGRRRGWTLSRALREGGFWGLFAVFLFTAIAIYAVSLQAVVFLVELGFSPIDAATAFGAVGMLSVGGMVGTGWLADRAGRRAAVALTFALTLGGIGAMALLTLAPAPALLVLFVVTFGPAQGSRGPIIATLVAELFPGGRIGAIYGAASMGMGLGAAVGSLAAGLLHDLTGSYIAGFALAAAAALVALGQFWWVPALARAGAARAVARR